MLSTGQVVVGIQSIFWPSTAPKLLTRRMDFCFPLWLRKSSTWKCEWDCEHVLWRNLFPSWPFWTLPFFRRNKNRWHVGGVQYTFPNWHLQNRRWESIIFFFSWEKETGWRQNSVCSKSGLYLPVVVSLHPISYFQRLDVFQSRG